MSVIIDRRLNDRNKSEANRQRFLRRYRQHIRKAVDSLVADRSIREMDASGEVGIRRRDLSEPAWRHGPGGQREFVLPGNREFVPGDHLKRPRGGAGSQGDGDGDGEDGEDDFTFVLSREEFLSIFFDELELPHMLRTESGDIHELKSQRAGYVTDGNQSNLAILRTMRQATARRIALTASSRRRLAELDRQALETDADDLHEKPAESSSRTTATPDLDDAVEVQEQEQEQAPGIEREELRRRIARVPFLDTVDLRYRHRILVPRPMSQAVMFCLMDVSASMDEYRKDLAKRFFTLLYLFLSRKYERVEIIFIRHTSDAEEVDEQRFFHDRATGGTVVQPALQLMSDIIEKRFPAREWNIYGAQASDGDAFGVDPEKSRQWLEARLLPITRYYAYLEVGDTATSRLSTLASAYHRIDAANFAMTRAIDRREIYPVFRDLFQRRAEAAPS